MKTIFFILLCISMLIQTILLQDYNVNVWVICLPQIAVTVFAYLHGFYDNWRN